jgi:DNA-binding GntR family transcriptional regulator
VLEVIAVLTLTGTAFDKLVEVIASGKFKSGLRLFEAMLAHQFGISRGPLREALPRLAGE